MKTTIDIALQKIRKFFRKQRRLPSYQEVADMMGFASKNAAYKLMQKLIDGNYIDKDESGRLIPKYLFSASPVSGIIKAGFPVAVTESMSDIATIDEYLIDHPEQTIILRVSGDSMVDAGIFEGDMVLVDTVKKPKIRDIVVAQVDEEFTLKYYMVEQGRPVLVPANSRYSKIYPKNKLEMTGTVISVIRKLN